jgi:transcriptional regulator with XRE-family HTH domain
MTARPAPGSNGAEGGVLSAREPRWVAAGPDKPEREELLRALGARLRASRESAGLSQSVLAVRCVMRSYEISEFERGARAPGLPALLVLADRLSIPVSDSVAGLPAPVRREGTALVLDLIGRRPGVSTKEIAASLGLPCSYALEITLYLNSTRAIAPLQSGWRATAQQPGERGVRH